MIFSANVDVEEVRVDIQKEFLKDRCLAATKYTKSQIESVLGS